MAAVADQLLAAVRDVIAGLNLSPVPQLIVRKQLKLQETEGYADPAKKTGVVPVILIAANEPEKYETVGSGGAKGKVLYAVTYPVGIAVVVRNGGRLGDGQTSRDWGEQIWPVVVSVPLMQKLGAPVNSVNPSGKTVFDMRGLDAALIDYTSRTFAVEVLVER